MNLLILPVAGRKTRGVEGCRAAFRAGALQKTLLQGGVNVRRRLFEMQISPLAHDRPDTTSRSDPRIDKTLHRRSRQEYRDWV